VDLLFFEGEINATLNEDLWLVAVLYLLH